MRDALWLLCTLLALYVGWLAKEKLTPPVFIPIKIVKQAPEGISTAAIWTKEECRRVCYARVKSTEVKPK